jgi:hypothetical protein
VPRGARTARFVGVRSQGAEVAGRHRLVSVTAADAWGESEQLADAAGLDSVEVLEWLCGVVRPRFEGRRLVVFSGRYDVAQWLAGAPRKVLAELWAHGEARWYRHAAATGPSRISLHMVDGHSFGVWLPGMRSRLVVADVYGLFQSSLADAFAEWGEPPPADKTDECAALARLIGKVSLSARRVGIRPSSWSSGGALAGALLRDHDTRSVIRKPAREAVELACLTAYYGGRVDMLMQGSCSRVVALDIRGAYPAALAGAPSLVGRWRHIASPPDDIPATFGVWRARFTSPPLRALTPLPVRQVGRVVWPAAGEGWWHGVELRAAIDTGAEVDVLEGYVFTPRRDQPDEPWRWIRDLYAERLRLQAARDPAEGVVKLALNSLYGKLAQNVGTSPYQCFALAGYVTAAVRARMLRAASITPSRVIAIHTDGMLLDWSPGDDGPRLAVDLDAPVSRELGAWSVKHGRDLLIVQPGVYTYDDPEEGRLVARRLASKQRGVPADTLTWERIEDAWRGQGVGGRVTVRQRMHHGIGTCAHRRSWGELGQWVEESRDFVFSATTRFPSFTEASLQSMLPVTNGGVAIPFEPAEPDKDELLRREQPSGT